MPLIQNAETDMKKEKLVVDVGVCVCVCGIDVEVREEACSSLWRSEVCGLNGVDMQAFASFQPSATISGTMSYRMSISHSDVR